MSLDALRFDTALAPRPPATGLAVETALEHFSIVTYMVDPGRLRRLVHPRFAIDEIEDASGRRMGLVSAVTFRDRDFRLAALGWPRWQFGQTNYRSYVTDSETGQHVAWFFGTVLDSRWVVLPRHVWRLPWYRAAMRFQCKVDEARGSYGTYRVSTQSRWAPAELELADSGEPPASIPGFSSVEAGLVLLTQPTIGFYHRRDGVLGSYAIWHDRMTPTVGRAVTARHPLLERLGLVAGGSEPAVHSVLMQRAIDFTIYLPPRAV